MPELVCLSMILGNALGHSLSRSSNSSWCICFTDASTPKMITLTHSYERKRDFVMSQTTQEENKVLQMPNHQNFTSGRAKLAFTSVETLTSRQRSASAARVLSAWPEL